MSKLVNAKIGCKCPIIDSRLKNIVYFNSNCFIPEFIITQFEKCFTALADQLESENFFENENIPYVTCIIIEHDMFSIQLEKDVLGSVMSFAVYPMLRWDGLHEIHICACILEELCHFFWNIRDEKSVNYKVIEVLNRIYPNVKIDQIYKM